MPGALKGILAVGISLGVVVVANHFSGPSAAQRLDSYLDRFERVETARLSAASGEVVLVTVSLDCIGPRRDEPNHTLEAVVHVKRNGLEYDRRCLLYEPEAEAWAWEPRTDENPGNE
jgi:hypothetical protein